MGRLLAVSALVVPLLAGVPAQAGAAAAVRTSVHVDFGPRTTRAPAGYLVDYGLPFTAKRAYGWERVSNGKALSLVGKGVKRPAVKGRDRRWQTLLPMQAAHSPAARWQVALRNGVYDVTVGVGDSLSTGSVDRVTAQPHTARQVVLVGGFRPTKAHHFYSVTKRVRVSDGRLTLSPVGGVNTKIDFVVATPVRDSVAPTVTITLAGTPAGPATYDGPVTASVAVADNSGGSGTGTVTYVLDGAAAQPYTAPVVVTAPGAHTLSVTARDRAGNTRTAAATWTQRPPVLSLTDDFTKGGAVGAQCAVTGFDGVLPNTAGNQCDASRIAFVPAGLQLTSSAGQLAEDTQQNALYKAFDASSGTFSLTARLLGPVNQLTKNYQQVGAWFGPDQHNFVKVEAEHNGAALLTMFYRENGVAGTVGSVPLPAVGSTLDLVIRGTAGTLTVFYSVDGAALVQVGSARTPAARSAWFSTASKAGIEVSNTGSASPITATFSRLSITG